MDEHDYETQLFTKFNPSQSVGMMEFALRWHPSPIGYWERHSVMIKSDLALPVTYVHPRRRRGGESCFQVMIRCFARAVESTHAKYAYFHAGARIARRSMLAHVAEL